MSRKVLLPRKSRFLPSKDLRQEGIKRNSALKLEDFECLEDWFFFTHIDPTQRLIHAVGMILGLIFFSVALYNLWHQEWIGVGVSYFIGVFFYYVSGIISHQFYDAGTGRSHPKYLLPTFIPVIKINLATTFGYYDQVLREFIRKYPFVIEAYDLVEVPIEEYSNFLRGSFQGTRPAPDRRS